MRAAGRVDLGVGFSEQRLIAAGLEQDQAAGSKGTLRARKKNADAFQRSRVGCHGCDELQLLRETLRIAGQLESFLRELRGRGVMAVRLVVVGRETRDDDVGPEFADRPDRVGQNLVAIPEAQRLRGRLRESEIVRAREELLAVIDPARGQQFLGADDAQLFAQLRADQILPAVAARQRKIGGVVKRAVRPIGDQAGVLVVRMRGDVKRASEHIQFLQREPDFRRVHRPAAHQPHRQRAG